ncbi:MAG: alpha-glucan family phosphorylase, partial [Planctomycetota bacterium]
MPQRPFQLFEISWEVCNKVGGIHTVLSSKATTAVARYGDDYVVVGPQLHSGGGGGSGNSSGQQLPFDEEPGHEDFVAACRHAGVPVRVGRWRIPGRPRCILVGFSGLYEDKDGLLAGLWERHQVDSIAGGWDYVEPVLFSIAAARVIERWWEEYLAPFHRRAVVHAHEWMTGAALLQLQDRIPSIGTVFTTHATVLGRSLASLGVAAAAPEQPDRGGPGTLGAEGLAQLAEQHGVQAKHSLEGVAARKADVLTTVSALTGDEVERLHARRAEPLLPNGIDLDVVDELVSSGPLERSGPSKTGGKIGGKSKAGKETDRGAARRLTTRRELSRIAGALLGEDVQDAAYVALAGRYEFHNKGIELLLDALAEMNPGRGRRVVAFVLVPAGNSGVLGELMDRLEGGGETPAVHSENHSDSEPLGLCTHNLFDEDVDPLHVHCKKLGLDNAKGSRVKIVQIPIYLRPDDGFLHREYEAVLAAMDVGVYPSFYEPWGYTPQEALAVGVPTITSDLAGFGRWANANKLGPRQGITVIPRENVPYQEVLAATVEALEGLLDGPDLTDALRKRCREAAGRTAWRELYDNYIAAYGQALDAVQRRSKAGVQQFRLPKRALPRPLPSAGAGASPRLTSFEATATLPQSLRGLERLARNFWWVWNPQARALFEDLAHGFADAGESPVAFLQSVGAEALQLRAEDRKFQRRVARVLEAFDAYMQTESRLLVADSGAALDAEHPIAYFSAEFGVHQSLPVYSGGLGILAGDHLKSASDLGLPLVGVGLFYRFGYMQQQLAADGSQIAADRENRPGKLAVELVRNADGSALEVHVPMPGRDVTLRAWCAMVGRVRLFLLDANVPSNSEEDRDITRNLYGGDSETRIQQEILLGRGGVRMLRAMDVRPAVYHMNEGHAAFLTLERVSRIVKGAGLPFEAAREYV